MMMNMTNIMATTAMLMLVPIIMVAPASMLTHARVFPLASVSTTFLTSNLPLQA
jgi:hypothetical protein